MVSLLKKEASNACPSVGPPPPKLAFINSVHLSPPLGFVVDQRGDTSKQSVFFFIMTGYFKLII